MECARPHSRRRTPPHGLRPGHTNSPVARRRPVHAPPAATWRRSSRSTGNGNNCVELADLGEGVGVRDSKAPHAGALLLPREAWREIAERVKAGDLDL
ncbi:DUF397 domain-containing protein [Actinomadura sp. CNU-125]|uniref:DUF397 domain-containing protein n=1 Tax=Actinomadura sp. CNU-125 TaxID=1904961 RepID=UPI0009F8F486|nr:DUF397 domain-containing protein [Actinomadura sp. CNU-125]